MFKPVGSLIKEIPARTKIASTISALLVRRAGQDALGKVCEDLAPEIVESVKISTFKNGALTIVAPSLVLAELKLRSADLTGKINRLLGKRVVKSLRFRAR